MRPMARSCWFAFVTFATPGAVGAGGAVPSEAFAFSWQAAGHAGIEWSRREELPIATEVVGDVVVIHGSVPIVGLCHRPEGQLGVSPGRLVLRLTTVPDEDCLKSIEGKFVTDGAVEYGFSATVFSLRSGSYQVVVADDVGLWPDWTGEVVLRDESRPVAE